MLLFFITLELLFQVYDGYDETAFPLLKTCGTLIPDPITSSSDLVYIVMSINRNFRGSFFLLEWSEVLRNTQPIIEIQSHPGN